MGVPKVVTGLVPGLMVAPDGCWGVLWRGCRDGEVVLAAWWAPGRQTGLMGNFPKGSFVAPLAGAAKKGPRPGYSATRPSAPSLWSSVLFSASARPRAVVGVPSVCVPGGCLPVGWAKSVWRRPGLRLRNRGLTAAWRAVRLSRWPRAAGRGFHIVSDDKTTHQASAHSDTI